MIRPTRTLLVALVAVPFSAVACTTDFDRFLGSGGAGDGGSTTATTVSAGGAGGMGQGGAGGSDPCAGVDCDDLNPCTDDVCTDAVCTHPTAAAPDLSALQVVGDCQVIVCTGDPPNTGPVGDDQDIVDDANECTQEVCLNGSPHPYEVSGTTCNGNGVCNATGSCSACNTAADCGTATNCGTPTCAGSPLACGWSYVMMGTVVGTDGTTGNCMSMICNGTSENSVVGINNLDLPANVNNDCRSPSCTAGVPGQATINDTDVPLPTAGDCKNAICSAGNPSTTTNNADLPPNVMNDCKQPACNGGVPGTANDNTDLPVDVANDCKDPACAGGNPTTTDQSTGTACDDAGAEAMGQCMTGLCRDCTTNGSPGCNVGNLCQANACCMPMSMAVACAGKDCGNVSDGCGGMVACGTCATSLKGPNCNANLCGCAMDNDCDDASHLGEDCVTGGVCGCSVSAVDCPNSPRGKTCLATFVCGCTVAGQATDCAGIGAATCNGATGVCVP